MVVFLFPVFHPIPGFVLLVLLLTIPLGSWIYFKRNNRDESQGTTLYFNKVIAAMYFVWSTFWISSFAIFNNSMKSIYQSIMSREDTSIGALINQISYAAQYHYDIVSMFLKIYGGLSILIIATIIALLILWIKRQASYQTLFAFAVPLFIIVIFIIIFYLSNFGFSPARLLQFLITICTLFAAYLFYKILRPEFIKYSKIKSMGMITITMVLILTLFILGGLTLYPSRYILRPNDQVTEADIYGANWYLQRNDTNMVHTFSSVIIYRFADLLLTNEEKSARKDIVSSYYYYTRYQFPYHFGYDKDTNLGKHYDQDIYMVLNQADRVLYQDVYPEIAGIRFEPQDFERLENDASIDKLYNNEGFDIYYIHAIAEPYD